MEETRKKAGNFVSSAILLPFKAISKIFGNGNRTNALDAEQNSKTNALDAEQIERDLTMLRGNDCTPSSKKCNQCSNVEQQTKAKKIILQVLQVGIKLIEKSPWEVMQMIKIISQCK